MTGPGSKEDLAFTTSRLGYKTGKTLRRPNQVIRIKSGKGANSKMAKETLRNLDLSVSKLGFSDEELNYDESQPDIVKSLVLVVGECFEDQAEDLLGDDSPRKRVSDDEPFDFKAHACIETRDTAIVVQKLQDKSAQFYMKESHKHIVFYSEFVEGERLAGKENEKLRIQESILMAKSRLVETLPERAKRSLQPDKDILPPTTLTAKAFRSWIVEAVSSYVDTRSQATLDQILQALHKVFQGSVTTSGEFDVATENQWQHIRRLGEGDMTLDNAQEFIVAYKELFPDISSLDDIVAEAIIELDIGIHEGGLSSVPTSPIIPDALYRNFVSIFCGFLSWSKSMGMPAPRVKAVAHAYQMAIRGTGSPFPKYVPVVPVVPVDAGPFRTILESADTMILSLIRTADMAIRATVARAAKPGHRASSIISGSSLKAASTKGADFARTNALLNSITQRESVENNNIMQLFRNMLLVTHNLHLGVMKAHDEFHGKAASDPTEHISEDVEMEDVGRGG
ncbi:hypothetical protein ACHAQD_008956 [Fusarium lateritium]